MSRRLLEILLTRGFSAPEADPKGLVALAEEIEQVQQRREQRQDEADRKRWWLMALTFVVWLASVVGFGVHAFRVRRADREPPPGENRPGPDAPIPGGSPGP